MFLPSLYRVFKNVEKLSLLVTLAKSDLWCMSAINLPTVFIISGRTSRNDTYRWTWNFGLVDFANPFGERALKLSLSPSFSLSLPGLSRYPYEVAFFFLLRLLFLCTTLLRNTQRRYELARILTDKNVTGMRLHSKRRNKCGVEYTLVFLSNNDEKRLEHFGITNAVICMVLVFW